MREPKKSERAFFLSVGDIAVMEKALAKYLVGTLQPHEREHAGALRERFLEILFADHPTNT